MNKNMNDPRVNRLIGYVIFFSSMPFFGAAVVLTEVAGGILSMLLLLIGAALFAASVIWMIRKVRCPHCGALLHLKLYSIRRCPYCGRDTDPDSTE